MNNLKLVEDFLRLVENFDHDGVLEVSTPDATVWHNDGKGEEPIAQSSENMLDRSNEMKSMHYEVIRQFAQGDEVLQQHNFHIVFKNDERYEVHAAMYFRFAGGLLERLEEYANVLPPQADRPRRT